MTSLAPGAAGSAAGPGFGASVGETDPASESITTSANCGMNCAFEDCAELMRLMDEHHGWTGLFEAFEHERRPNTDAIAQMALENYQEMRATVLDANYRRQKKEAEEREKQDPNVIPRYSVVMFHPELPYTAALRSR